MPVLGDDVHRVRQLETAAEREADADRAAVDELPVPEPDRLAADRQHLDRARPREDRRSCLAPDVLRERSDALILRVQVAPRLGVVIRDEQVHDLHREAPRIVFGRSRRTAAAGQREDHNKQQPAPHAFSIFSSPSSTETASVSLAMRSPKRTTTSSSGSHSLMRSVTSSPESLRSTFTSWMRS